MEIYSENSSWLARRLEQAFAAAITRAYGTVRVHPGPYLAHLRTIHGVPVGSYEEMFLLPVAQLDSIASQTVRGAMKMAGAEGAGMGLGGFTTVMPDVGILSAITLRMVQKLSLIYGFEYNTEEEVAELWIATATAAGLDLTKDLLERTVLSTFVERVVVRVAERVSIEFAEKAAARALPIVSSVVGGVLNFYFVRAWGNRVQAHFRQRHLEERDRRGAQMRLLGGIPAAPE